MLEHGDFSQLKMGLKTADMKLKNQIFIDFIKNKDLIDFTWHYIKNRYLIIIGGEIEYDDELSEDCNINSDIITFDFQTKMWNVLKHEHGLGLAPFYKQHFSFLMNNKIYSFGRGVSSQFKDKTHCVLSLVLPLNWKIERIIWIGYYEKENENFALLPKCIVKKILEYSKWYIFDNTHRRENMDESMVSRLLTACHKKVVTAPKTTYHMTKTPM